MGFITVLYWHTELREKVKVVDIIMTSTSLRLISTNEPIATRSPIPGI